MTYVWVFIAVAVLGVSSAWAQPGTIRGKITDGATRPLARASVHVVGTARGTLTGGDGGFALHVPAGPHTLQVTHIGYGSERVRVVVTAGDTVWVAIALAARALSGDEVVVVGSRTVRTALQTPAPVDVITGDDLAQSGETEIAQALRHLAPSFNASHQSISDGTDHVTPASLRGLGPDQVLVLVNGKRRHASALVHVNGTFGRGTVGVDLNALPKAAIKRVEILRDGAAAQYGSDAIAGVINLVLKDGEGLRIGHLAGATGKGDGGQMKTDVNVGFPLGNGGFFHVTGEVLYRGGTNRADPYEGAIFTSEGAGDGAELVRRGLEREDFTMRVGQSQATAGGAFYHAAYPLSGGGQLYSFGGLSHRKGRATGFYRLPHQEARVVLSLYPNGFLPEIHTEIADRSFSAGVRGPKGAWDVDFCLTHGGNRFGFTIENSNNASLGAASPTSFDAGRLGFDQTSGTLDLVRPLAFGASLVAGGAFRVERYRIEAGQAESYALGTGGKIAGVDFDTTSTGTPKAAGAQVFPGFQPSGEVDRHRNSASAYAGLETQLSARLLLDVGGRFERYSDFGHTVTGKAALRYGLTDRLSLRGTSSNGFRAPSLHQVWFNNVSTQFVRDATGDLVPRQVLTAHNNSPVANAFGMPALEEETSVNLSAGLTARMDNVAVTADYYHITIDDRIVLTSRFSDENPIYAALLKPFGDQGVSQAQFFANAVDTRTHGLDLVASYAAAIGKGVMALSAAATLTRTRVEQIHIPQKLIDALSAARGHTSDDDERDAIAATLFNREEKNRFEDALPKAKLTLGARYSRDKFSATSRATYYGSVDYKPVNDDNDETFGAKTLWDLDLTYAVASGIRLSVGAQNLLNTFPDKHRKNTNRSDGRFVYSRRVTQFGTNGGFYYARLRLEP